jgi:hypothetical protein
VSHNSCGMDGCVLMPARIPKTENRRLRQEQIAVGKGRKRRESAVWAAPGFSLTRGVNSYWSCLWIRGGGSRTTRRPTQVAGYRAKHVFRSDGSGDPSYDMCPIATRRANSTGPPRPRHANSAILFAKSPGKCPPAWGRPAQTARRRTRPSPLADRPGPGCADTTNRLPTESACSSATWALTFPD